MTQDNSSSAATGAIARTPSVMRYDRVQSILENDPALKTLLGQKDQPVQKRNGSVHMYSRGVVLVTNALHERNYDAHSVDRSVVLALAVSVLQDQKLTLEKPPEKVAAPKAARRQRKTPEPKTDKPKAVEESSKPQPAKAKVKKARSARSEKAASAPIAKARSAPAVVPTEADLAAAEKPALVYYIYGNALSLAIALYRTLEVGDRLPGAEDRQAAASKMIEQLLPLKDTPVPMPKDLMPVIANAKASPNAESRG